jgi:hypothetical protein
VFLRPAFGNSERLYATGSGSDTGGLRSSDLNSITSLFFFGPKLRRGVSNFNVGQNLVINYIWTIPSPSSFRGPAAWAARGWQLGGFFTVQTGLPFTLLIGGDLGTELPNELASPGLTQGPSARGCSASISRRSTARRNVLPLTPKEAAASVRFIQPSVLRLSTEQQGIS